MINLIQIGFFKKERFILAMNITFQAQKMSFISLFPHETVYLCSLSARCSVV